MNSNLLVEGLKKALEGFQITKVLYSNISIMRRVLELEGRLNGFIYVKTISDYPHHWGITKNTVEKIKAISKPWCVILLYESPNQGYLISPKNYKKKTQFGQWPLAQGDYKISEVKSLEGIPKFSTFEELFDILKHEPIGKKRPFLSS